LCKNSKKIGRSKICGGRIIPIAVFGVIPNAVNSDEIAKEEGQSGRQLAGQQSCFALQAG